MLCGIAWRTHESVAGTRFDELRELCTAAGDQTALAIGMIGLVMDLTFKAHVREASQLASEAMAIIESVAEPTLTVALSFAAIYTKTESGGWSDVLKWSQKAIELADGDPSMGNLIFGSPLALNFAQQGLARYWLGRPGWSDDLRSGLSIARSADPAAYATVVTYTYITGIPHGVLVPDDHAMREIEDALKISERSGDDLALALARMTVALALVHRPTEAEHERGHQILAESSEMLQRQGYLLGDLPMVNVYLGRERARHTDRDDAVALMRTAVDQLAHQGQLLGWGVPATGVFVEALLDRGDDGDMAEAEAAIERLAAVPVDEDLVLREIWLLRLRALLARAHGDTANFAQLWDSYRNKAKALGFQGHVEWAGAAG
jgi:hypothetical protein